MQDTNDIALLREFAETQSDAAFESLVNRYVNLVYSAALRTVGDAHQAEEITQAVFIILARKAGNLRQGTILSGWLYQTARLTAANFQRADMRRARREQEAHMQSLLNETDPDPWPQIAPLLDHALDGLNEKDRNALVLRFFENKSLGEIGRAFGTSEDAAKMRVSRALEKLRKFFTRRDITLSATALAGTVSAHSVQAAPAGLAATVAAAKGSAAAAPILALAKGTLKFMAWTKVKIVIGATASALLVGGGLGTLAFKKWEAYLAYRGLTPPPADTGPDSWRTPSNSFADVERAAPQVRILPAKSQTVQDYLHGSADGLKWIGLGVPIRTIAWVAYDFRPGRVVFDTPTPGDRYDFITSLPQGSLEALQQELKSALSYSGRRESRDTDVLLLKVRDANTPGLRPATSGGTQNWNQPGRYYCDDVPLSSADRAQQGLGQFLEQVFGKPVVDQTGLTQLFNIDLRWDARHPSQREAIREAMLNRLGLELVPGRETVELLVVEKPRQ